MTHGVVTSATHEAIMHETEGWIRVLECLPEVKLIAWDGCHKIYLAFDDEAVAHFRCEDSAYEEAPAEMVSAGTPAEYLKHLRKWWAHSCGLRFVSGWRGDDYIPLIEQRF